MRLLIAEADTSLASLLQERFQQENFSVNLVATGTALSTLLEAPAFDLVVLDFNLRGLTGLGCISVLQRRWPDTSIILLSDANAVDDRVQAFNAGADDFLAKPFAIAELVARAQANLRRRNRPVHDVYLFEDLE
jgi:DNA-binding response OmpR family regulator